MPTGAVSSSQLHSLFSKMKNPRGGARSKERKKKKEKNKKKKSERIKINEGQATQGTFECKTTNPQSPLDKSF